MTGMTNYSAQNWAAYISGRIPMPALPAVYMALATAVGTDLGTGFTEVSASGYARVQVAGSVVTNGATSSGNAVLAIAAVPAWIQPGMYAYDTTVPGAITALQVLSKTGTTVTLNGNVGGAGVGNGDTISFSAFAPASGTAPSTALTSSVVTFPQALADWGTVIAFMLFDAATVGNMLFWDFMGNFSWLPFESTNVGSGNGPVVTAKANAYANLDPIVFSAEYGGPLPTLSAGTITGYTINFVANVATDSFTVTQTSGGAAILSSATGSGMVRKVTRQSIPQNVTASFDIAAMTLTVA